MLVAWCAGIAAVLFVAMIVLISTKKELVAEYVGLGFHLVLLPVVAGLDAPEWARMGGYGWLLIDSAIGVAGMNGWTREQVWPLRLGSHVLAAVWIVTASAAMGEWYGIVGIVLGLWMGGYSLVARWADMKFFMPSGALMVVWFGAIAFYT